MEVVKQTKEFTVVKKRSGRYGVKNAKGKWVNGDDKVKVLVAEGLVKQVVKQAPPAEETTEAPAEE